MAQMSLFDTVQDNDIIEELKGIDIGNLTPMEALNTLYNLQNKIKNRWELTADFHIWCCHRQATCPYCEPKRSTCFYMERKT